VLEVISVKFLRGTAEDKEVSKRSLEIRTAKQNQCCYCLVLLNTDLKHSNFKSTFLLQVTHRFFLIMCFHINGSCANSLGRISVQDFREFY
jgi:hypothetical protein